MRDLLRPYQSEALAKVRGALLENATRIMLQAPAGAGKTVLAASMAEDQIAFGNRVAFVVSDLSLIDQTIAAFNAQGIADIGIIQADHPAWNPNAAVQICSIRTLSRRGAPRVDFVLVDEAHKWHKAHEDWFSRPEMATIPVIGLTATPWRKGLDKHFQKLIKVTSTTKLIEEKYLSPFRAYAPAHPDLTGVKIVNLIFTVSFCGSQMRGATPMGGQP
jgi:DNA repair protein RadD